MKKRKKKLPAKRKNVFTVSAKKINSIKNTKANDCACKTANDEINNIDNTIVSTGKLVDLSLYYWKLEKHIKKIENSLEQGDCKRIKNALSHIKSFIDANNIDITDMQGQKYVEGTNLEILGQENDSDIDMPTIFDTIQPQISINDRVVIPAQVIIHNPVINPKDRQDNIDKLNIEDNSKTNIKGEKNE
jgi:hypothetical protein